MGKSNAAVSANPPAGRGSRAAGKPNGTKATHASPEGKPSGSEKNSTNGKPANQGGFITTLIEVAKRQESLIDLLTEAVDSGNEKAILQAARNLAANRRRPTQLPSSTPGRKKRAAA